MVREGAGLALTAPGAGLRDRFDASRPVPKGTAGAARSMLLHDTRRLGDIISRVASDHLRTLASFLGVGAIRASRSSH